ncbi:discoidin domain-containing protein [Diplocloster agilis]|uniref:discoidin domain-containing protein n=1 Tax=Diplocloster agilis TaxID=2850323 RepID=UPI000821DBD0|nr:discoidin domain-containing protein [Suonthocola fibrivorans]MCU6733267.1 discoidin domain-containing protein [Suonthocola fibrivorans]SCI83251.1 Alpha-galactosidase [uncultured Clostridium sp.]
MKKRKIVLSCLLSLSFILGNMITPADAYSQNNVGDSVDGPEEAANDAYVHYDQDNCSWTFGTSMVEKTVELTEGQFLLKSFKNKLTGQQYLTDGQPGSEFSIKVDGTVHTGKNGNWSYVTQHTENLDLGSILLVIELQNEALAVKRNYIIYPQTGVIEEYSTFTNRKNSSVSFSEPSVFQQNLLSDRVSNTDFLYMSGGGDFTGSHTLKTVPLSAGYSRNFDSRGPCEYTPGGVSDPVMIEGSSAWHQFFALHDREREEGMFIMFNYAGTWFADIGNIEGSSVSLNGYVHMHDKPAKAGETITTPLALTGIFDGDIDDMGNTITDFQYRYKWDATNDDYFNKANAFDLLGYQNKQAYDYTPNVFMTTANNRYLGVEINVIDDFWYDRKGDWNSVDSENFSDFNTYIKKNGQQMCVWSAPWQVQPGAAVLESHPEWQIKNDNDYWYNYHLDQSNPDVIEWERNLMDGFQEQWGSHMLKYDGEPMWPNGNTTGDPMHISSPSCDNHMLEASNRWLSLLRDFKTEHPNAGVYTCSSGGELMMIETLRYAEVTSTSDGKVGDINGYWNSLLFPIDKLMQGGYQWDETAYSKAKRWDLRFSPQLNMSNPWYAESEEDKEAMRKDFDLFRFLRAQGLSGRWTKVFRPMVSGAGIPEHFLQKTNRDATAGVIFTCADETVGTSFQIYPKGLIPEREYTITSLEGSVQEASKTGEEWMENGISLTPFQEGEVIFLNVEKVPGKGKDSVAPGSPSNCTKESAEYLYRPGVELNWSDAEDETWISYYEIQKNGSYLDKVSVGTSYFEPYGDVNDSYSVLAVDGDGNKSPVTEAEVTGTVFPGPLSRSGWTASATYADDQAMNILDGDFQTRWTGERQERDKSLTVDFGDNQVIDTIIMDTGSSPYDYPYIYELFLSQDGQDWEKVTSGRTDSGTGSIKWFTFAARTARYAKFAIKGTQEAKGWWDVTELYAYFMNGTSPYIFGDNLAFNKTASASSVENDDLQYQASHAVDGNPDTRWSSAFQDGEWWMVDLGGETQISCARLEWQWAFSRDYELQTSVNGTDWQTITQIQSSDGEIDEILFSPVVARYFRIVSTKRASEYGVSLIEVGLYAG